MHTKTFKETGIRPFKNLSSFKPKLILGSNKKVYKEAFNGALKGLGVVLNSEEFESCKASVWEKQFYQVGGKLHALLSFELGSTKRKFVDSAGQTQNWSIQELKHYLNEKGDPAMPDKMLYVNNKNYVCSDGIELFRASDEEKANWFVNNKVKLGFYV